MDDMLRPANGTLDTQQSDFSRLKSGRIGGRYF
jgi:hypothetical protein